MNLGNQSIHVEASECEVDFTGIKYVIESE